MPQVFYRVDFYDGKDSIQSYDTVTAPYAFSVGDLVDPSGWGDKNRLPLDELYEITSVEHQMSFPESPPEVQHNIAILVKSVQRKTSALA